MKARELTSPSNPRVKAARRLRERREREETGLFLVEGPHVLEVALASGARLSEVFCTAEFLDSHAGLAERLEGGDWPVWRVSEGILEKVAGTEQPQGVVAVVEQSAVGSGQSAVETQTGERRAQAPNLAASCLLSSLPTGAAPLILALEGVSDPGNVGNAIRAAHAAGASGVVLGPGCCDRFNPKAVRASAGGLFAVPSVETEDLVGLLGRLRASGASVLAAVPREAKPFWEVDMAGPTVLVVGSEAHGLSESVLAAATDRAMIPMPGGAESLNAAAAAAVLLYEAVRQRKR